MGVIPAGTQGVDVQIRYLVANQMCYNNFRYYCLDATADFSGVLSEVLTDWIDECLGLIRNLTTTDTQFLEARIQGRGGGLTNQSAIQNLVLSGTFVGQTMPPHDTLSFRVFPDLDNQLPGGSSPLRPGRISISGIPEAAQSNGLFTTDLGTEITAFEDGIVTFDTNATGAVETFRLRVLPDPTAVNPRQADVLDVDVRRIGTQLTRKR